jgi:hypothetical protein
LDQKDRIRWITAVKTCTIEDMFKSLLTAAAFTGVLFVPVAANAQSYVPQPTTVPIVVRSSPISNAPSGNVPLVVNPAAPAAAISPIVGDPGDPAKGPAQDPAKGPNQAVLSENVGPTTTLAPAPNVDPAPKKAGNVSVKGAELSANNNENNEPAFTGANSGVLLGSSALLVVVGSLLVAVNRRRSN